ncbi:Uncharacterized membrane protein YhaH, DUF805 family [Alteromonadaceae bacterium Bs31]|nr:Uncharacterized membrane protein YhaH, DUF805 family [Alteromonadaceae bacterium Bs31]
MAENIYKAPESNVDDGSYEVANLSMKEILFSFSGRIPRKTYWLSFLGLIAALIVLIVLLVLIGVSESVLSILTLIIYIPALWISLAIQVKRWHDRDKSGWWVLISIIPIIGPIWAFVENGCLAGDEGVNRFGPPSA